MCKKSKKLMAVISLLCLFTMLFSLTSVFADDAQNEDNELYSLLYNDKVIADINMLMQNVLPDPEDYGVIGADLSRYSICKPILAKRIGENQQNDKFCVYPIVDANNNLILTSTAWPNKEGYISVQLDLNHVEDILNTAQYGEEIALLHTDTRTFFITPESAPAVLSNEADEQLYSDITFTTITAVEEIDVASIPMTYATGKTLNIPSRNQDGYNLCWAACVSSIGEYKTGTYKSIYTIANNMGISYDVGATTSETSAALGSQFSLSNGIDYSTVKYSNVKSNVDANKPTIGEMEAADTYNHAVAMCGYTGTQSSGTLIYMDSNYGTKRSVNISGTGTFTYWYTINGKEYLFESQDFIYLR